MFKSFQITIPAIPIPFAIKCTTTLCLNIQECNCQCPFLERKLKILQKYVAESKYYRGNNKHGEKTKFVESFSLQNWEQLSNRARLRHTLENCKPCQYEIESSSLHISYGLDRQEALLKCTHMTEALVAATDQPKTAKGSINVAKTIINTIKPVFEKKRGKILQMQ